LETCHILLYCHDYSYSNKSKELHDLFGCYSAEIRRPKNSGKIVQKMLLSTPFGTNLNGSLPTDNKKQEIKKELNNDLQAFLAAQSQRNPRLRNQRSEDRPALQANNTQPAPNGIIYFLI
jgi:hypothetical protein